MPGCLLCPRRCGQPRTAENPGFCGSSEPADAFRVARLIVHRGEEPCISGIRGSGTVFFSGCSLRCCFCQNYEISLMGHGQVMSREHLQQAMLELAALDVHNLNLVTPSHYADRMPQLLSGLRASAGYQQRPVPVVWNSSGYETPESLAGLAGLVDVFMPDLKYFDPELSKSACGAPDYFKTAAGAILSMHQLQPETLFDPDGMLTKGLMIRHLILPGHWRDSCRILDFLSDSLPPDIPISLLSQFTPQANLLQPSGHPEFSRRLTTLEYQKVAEYALCKGFSRLTGQDRSSASSCYTPDFKSF